MPETPTHLGQYDILGVIGSGGMGVVYKGFQPSLNRLVAIKVLPAHFQKDRERVERFHREAQAVALLSHPNIVQIIDKGREGELMYFVMEYVDGRSLDALTKERRLSLAEALHVVKEIAKGLDYVHSHGVIHRDLKPRNILVSSDLSVVKVVDFGISRMEVLSQAAGTLTTANTSLGTLYYFSPEQALDSATVDHRTDLYSLGVICYEMLTGRVPVGKFQLPSEVNPQLSASVDAMVLRCLASDRGARYQSARVLMDDIDQLEKAAGFKLLDELKRMSSSTSRLLHSSADQLHRTKSALSGRYALAGAVLAVVAAVALAASVYRTRYRVTEQPQAPGAPVATAPASPAAAAPSAASSAASGTPAPAAPQEPATLPPPAEATAPAPAAPDEAAASGPGRDAGQRPAASAPSAQARPAARPKLADTAAADKTAAAAAAGARAEAAARDRLDEAAQHELDLARNKIGNRQFAEAQADLKGFIGRYPAHPLAFEAYGMLASIQEKQGDAREAIASYRDIGERFRDDPRAAGSLYRLAQLELQAGNEEDARLVLGAIQQRYQNGQWTLAALGMKATLEERMKVRERDPVLATMVPAALLTYRALVDAYPTHPSSQQAFMKLADMYEDLRRYDLAARSYADLGSNFPNNPYDAWFKAGELFERRINDRASALRAYRQVPASSKNYREAQKRAERLLQ